MVACTNKPSNRRGRPAGLMTHNRRRVLEEVSEALARGERITLSALARKCGLYSRNEARRTLRDLRRFGMV